MVGFLAGDHEPREISAVALLFGGQITHTLPLPGLAIPTPVEYGSSTGRTLPLPGQKTTTAR